MSEPLKKKAKKAKKRKIKGIYEMLAAKDLRQSLRK